MSDTFPSVESRQNIRRRDTPGYVAVNPNVLLARFEVKQDTGILHNHVEEKQRGQLA